MESELRVLVGGPVCELRTYRKPSAAISNLNS